MSRRAAPVRAPERIRVEEAAVMLGLTRRGVQAMAARGELPGAAKIGSIWTFDRTKLERFIADAEARTIDRASAIRAAMKSWRIPPSIEPTGSAAQIEAAYKALMAKMRGMTTDKRKPKQRGKRTT